MTKRLPFFTFNPSEIVRFEQGYDLRPFLEQQGIQMAKLAQEVGIGWRHTWHLCAGTRKQKNYNGAAVKLRDRILEILEERQAPAAAALAAAKAAKAAGRAL
jgi:hypothetical protein